MSLVTPHQLDIWSSQMGELYNALEGEILRTIIERLTVGELTDIQTWHMEKLQQLHLFNSDVVKLLDALTPHAEAEIKRVFEETVKSTIEDVDSRVPNTVDPPTQTHVDQVMKGYYEQAWSGVENYVNQTLVSTNYGTGAASQAYTDVLNRTSAVFNTGIFTFEQALERSITELAEKGIQSRFIDQGGHTWSLERYVQTVMKSTLNNTYDEVKKDRMSEFGLHTVVVTSHAGARLACEQIQGQVVDLRRPEEIPEDSNIRSIYDPYWGAQYGEKGGHRGINCNHAHIPFIEGVNVNNQPKFDKDLNRRVAKQQDRQRAIERNIVKYKKRSMVANELGSENASKWSEMVNKWENKMTEHLEENGEYLGRNLPRERVYTPLETLMEQQDLYS